MSRPSFLADHDLDEDILRGVARREPCVEILRARDLGLARLPDPEILERAAGLGKILLTHDARTMIGHARNGSWPGGPCPDCSWSDRADRSAQ